MIVLRLGLAVAFGTVVLLGLGFAIGATSGWAYGSRDKVCAEIERNGARIVVCDYGYELPPEAVVQ